MSNHNVYESENPLTFIVKKSGGGINLFRIYSYRSIYIERKTVYPFRIIARNYEQVVSRILHVDGGCSVGLWFSNMKNKKHCHMILHLVHNPTL